jgi:hypothetical protein
VGSAGPAIGCRHAPPTGSSGWSLLAGLELSAHTLRQTRDQQTARRIEGEVLDVEGDELGAAQGGGEPEQQQRPVAPAGERREVDRIDQPGQRVELERRGRAQHPGAVLAADPRQDRGDRPGIARIGMVLGAVRGGDRRRPARDRDRRR